MLMFSLGLMQIIGNVNAFVHLFSDHLKTFSNSKQRNIIITIYSKLLHNKLPYQEVQIFGDTGMDYTQQAINVRIRK